MKRVLLVVAYDGTNYVGWQKQPNGKAVEEVLNNALSELTGEHIEVIGASRTDAGVHAIGNVAVFDTESPIPADKFSFALNKGLPDDVVIQESYEVSPDFHPRHADCIKTYTYTIHNADHPNPVNRRYAYFVHGKIDIDAMRRAAGSLVGRHDFATFCSAHAQVKSTVRTVYSVDIDRDEDDMIHITITGNGFLYNMVRIIAGTLVAVGRHQISPENVQKMLDAKDRSAAGPTAPPMGLTLVEIEYQTDPNINNSESD